MTEKPKKRKSHTRLEESWRDHQGNNTFWELFDNLCQIQCTSGEIAAVFGTTRDRLGDACHRVHGKGLGEYRKERSEGGKGLLRRRQWQAAMEGNVTMLIWLGKNMLGQSDSGPAQVAAKEAREVALARRAVEKNPKLIDEIFIAEDAAGNAH